MMARFNSGGPEAHMLRMKAHLDEYENQFKKEPSKEDVQKAVQGACGKMDEENRITSGPLKNPELLLQWLKSIHFQGPILKMLTDNDLLKPKCWLGGGKSSGENISRDFKTIFVAIQYQRCMKMQINILFFSDAMAEVDGRKKSSNGRSTNYKIVLYKI